MKAYTDTKETKHYQTYENLNDVLKANLSKAFVFEKALKEIKDK